MNPRIDLNRDEILFLKSQKLTTYDMAAILGVARVTLMQKMRAMGLTVCNNKPKDDSRSVERWRLMGPFE